MRSMSLFSRLRFLLFVMPIFSVGTTTTHMTTLILVVDAAVSPFPLEGFPRRAISPGAKNCPYQVLVVRGGGVERESDKDDDTTATREVFDEGSSSSVDDGTDNDSILSDEQLPSRNNNNFRNPQGYYSPGPFRMLHEIREEAVALAQMVPSPIDRVVPQESSESHEETDDTTESKDESSLDGSSKTGRALVGGASVLEKEKQSNNRNGRVVGAPASMQVDTSRVAPLSLRLLEELNTGDSEDSLEDVEESLDSVVANTVPQENVTQFSKLWWVNLRQQLSDVETIEVPLKEEEESEEESLSPSDVSGEAEEEKEEEEEEEENFDDLSLVPAGSNNALDGAKMEIELDEQGVSDLLEESQEQAFDKGTVSSFVSSGLWAPIDSLLTLGLASKVPSLRISSKLRGVRKVTARVTGLHGFISRKPHRQIKRPTGMLEGPDTRSDMEDIQRRKAAVDKVREHMEGINQGSERRNRRRRSGFRFGWQTIHAHDEEAIKIEILEAEKRRLEEEIEQQRRREEESKEEERRMTRVKEIDQMIYDGQARLQQLICEKDVLQRRLNPLFNYTTEAVNLDGADESESTTHIKTSRKFKFPPEDLVEEYLEMVFSSRRLAKMNHTDLWQDPEADEDDESIGDDLLTPSVDAHKLYQDIENRDKSSIKGKPVKGRNGSGGSWLLRQTLGKGPSIGEKIGEVAETAAYKAVCAAVMAFLARLLSSLHGVNVMKHSDIRLVLEQGPDLPRVGEGIIPGSYAQETIKTVMRRKARRSRRRSKYQTIEDSFVQRDAVTEMLLSHVQISTPLLKLFPLAWQRAFLGNIITLATAIMADFFEGLQFQILGHSLTLAFVPITQDDMINHLGLSGLGFNRRRAKAEEFEAAVRATAEDVSEGLQFLDRWHERALGSAVLRTQIANLIARIVLTLTDEVLSGARFDLWSAQAGGPRLLAGLEYRATE